MSTDPIDKPLNAAPETDTKPPAGEKTPAEIRAEIEETREQLGDTVEALAAKTDVKGRAKDKVEDTRQQAKDKVEDVKAQAKAKVEEAKEAAPESPEEASRQAQALGRQTQKAAEENPKPFLIAGGVVVFVLLWRWLRS